VRGKVCVRTGRNGVHCIMSSGERAKPPAYEERNPFDISRRSGTEVAAEIAQRLSAWKQARGRSYAMPPASRETDTAGAKSAPLAAPVQPARLPQFTQPVARPQQTLGTPQRAPAVRANPDARVPLFATANALRRAMPPAPGLKPLETAQPHIERPVEPAAAEDPPIADADATDLAPAVEAHAPASVDSNVELAADAESRDSPFTVHKLESATEQPRIAEAIRNRIAIEDAAQRDVLQAETMTEGDFISPAFDEPVVDGSDIDEQPAEQVEAIASQGTAAPDTDHDEQSDVPAPVQHEVEHEAPGETLLDEVEAATARPIGDKLPPEAAPAVEQSEQVTAAPRSEIEIAPAPELAAPDPEPRLVARVVELPRMQTRIEQRRAWDLRADPVMAGRRPIFPHIEPDAWEASPPAIAAQRREAGGGTGWAIGLGALLLIAGLTAPAAIWQGRERPQTDQMVADQVVALVPAPEPSPTPAAAVQPKAPDAPASAPQQAAAEPIAPSPPPAILPTAGNTAPTDTAVEQSEETALSAVRTGGEIAVAPIIKPPAPQAESAPAPKPAGQVATAAPLAPAKNGQEPAFQPVAHPFIPEGGRTPVPFQPDAGAGTFPIGGNAAASVGLKPALIPQLKPQQAAAVPTAKTATSAPKPGQKSKPANPRNLDEMFNKLIETLSEGRQPVNPNNVPIPPSTRK